MILGHLGDLMDWALTLCEGEAKWVGISAPDWPAGVTRFYASIAALDAYLASEKPVAAEIPRLLAGPVADALTHVGQLALLRRTTGSPTIGENYYAADIVTGRVGIEQAPARRPFR